MPFTLVAYSESNDSATLTEIDPIDDQHMSMQNDDLWVPEHASFIHAYWFGGVSLTQARLQAPSMAKEGVYIDSEENDVNTGGEPSSPPNFHDLFDNPIALKSGEGLRTLMAEDGAGGTVARALVWLGDGKPVSIVKGREFTIRWTGTTTLVANAWTLGTITLAQTLPEGKYAIVGMYAQAAGLVAARLVTPNESGIWRAGILGSDADGDILPARFRHGRAGQMGTFDSRIVPQIEYLSNAADTAETGLFDLIKIK